VGVIYRFGGGMEGGCRKFCLPWRQSLLDVPGKVGHWIGYAGDVLTCKIFLMYQASWDIE